MWCMVMIGKGIQKPIRLKVIKTLRKWGGRLIEPKYTENISSTIIKRKYLNFPQSRVSRLKRLIYSKDIVRILESHNSLLD